MKSAIESLLYIAARPLSFKELAKLTNLTVSEVEAIVKELIEEYNSREGGIKIIQNGNQVEMVTNPKNARIVEAFLQEELTSDLTPAALETLSIIAYRQPVTKEELERIRGVNCAIILRNLLIRGLIEQEEKEGKTFYRVSLDFIRHLGINDVSELPDYERLSKIEIQFPNYYEN
jgi:segregation and condensation protein B